MVQTDRRRRYDFRRFKQELEQLGSEEIRERLNSNRIRSLQRRAVAEEVLRERAESAEGEAAEAVSPEAATSAGARAGASVAGTAAAGGQAARETVAGLRKGVLDVLKRARQEDVPIARRAGRVLGTVLVVGGAVALVAGLLRR